ncbi:MAG: hypothetical protein ACRDY7_09445 [Acidimicrobiia bacterium]
MVKFQAAPTRLGVENFERVWRRPERHPDGMERAFACWSEDGREVIGIAFWDSKESCDRWRASEAETHRRQAMSPYVEEERETFYTGRELRIPG